MSEAKMFDADSLIRALENARKKFLETANNRNPLLNVNRTRSLSNRLNIINGDCDSIFESICGEKKTLSAF